MSIPHHPVVERLASLSGSRETRLAMLAASRLFDADGYLALYPEVRSSGAGALVHYLDHGGGEGRRPHPLFDGAFYLAESPDIAAAGLNPLVHYLEAGAAEGRNPNPLFDTRWYIARHLAGAPYATNPLAHYLDNPHHDTSPAFQSRWYRANAMPPDEDGNPLAHYLHVGRQAGALCNADDVVDLGNPSYRLLAAGLFDAGFYAEANPDVAAGGFRPFAHYRALGHAEGRNPSPLFDLAHYLAQLPAEMRAGLEPLRHFVEHGAAAGLNPNPWFDTGWYVARYPESLGEGHRPPGSFHPRRRTVHPSVAALRRALVPGPAPGRRRVRPEPPGPLPHPGPRRAPGRAGRERLTRSQLPLQSGVLASPGWNVSGSMPGCCPGLRRTNSSRRSLGRVTRPVPAIRVTTSCGVRRRSSA